MTILEYDEMQIQSNDIGIKASLCSKIFFPGGVVRGYLQLRAGVFPSNYTCEIAYVIAQIHGHVVLDTNLLSVPVIPLLSPRRASDIERRNIENVEKGVYFYDDQVAIDTDDGNDLQEIDEESMKIPPKVQRKRTSSNTTVPFGLPNVRNFLGNPGSCIYQSSPSILLSDVNIAPLSKDEKMEHIALRGQREFTLKLPKDMCPSFRGISARVFYILSLTVQLANHLPNSNAPTSISIHLPFDLHASEYYFSPRTLQSSISNTLNEQDQQVKESNINETQMEIFRSRSTSAVAMPAGVRSGVEVPFELRSSLMHGRSETELFGKAQTRLFTIGDTSKHLMQFMLLKQSYQPGEVVLGVFDFTKATFSCLSIAAKLCFQEILADMALVPSKIIQEKVIDTFLEPTNGVQLYHMKFCIPMDALPSIQTDLVCFTWILKFEFMTIGQQSMKWEVPITIKSRASIYAEERRHFAKIPHKFFTGATREMTFLSQ